MDWTFILKHVFIGGVATIGGMGIAAWLTKRILIHFLDKDLNNFKTQLQHLYNSKLEEIKSDHTIKELEYETKFKSLHTRRFELITELYSKLRHTQTAISNYVKPLVLADDESESERGKRAAEVWNNLSIFYQCHKLFFTESECALIDKYIQTMKSAHIDFTCKALAERPTSAWIKAEASMSGAVVEICEMLEKEFRGKLGL